MHIQFHTHLFHVQQCDYIYQNKFFKCTYIHLCLFHSKPVQHIHVHPTLGLLTHNATLLNCAGPKTSHLHMYVLACENVCGGCPHPTTPYSPTHSPQGGLQISKNSISLGQIKIFQFCLKIGHWWKLLHLWVGVWFAG